MRATTQPQPSTLRTIYTKGMLKSLDTHLSDDEAFKICGTLSDDFSRDIFGKYDLVGIKKMSANQIFYAHRNAIRSLAPKEVPKGDQLGDMQRIYAMFQRAAAKLLHPAITICDGTLDFRIYPAGVNSKNAGFLYVRNRETYFGKISPKGEFFASRECGNNVTDYLRQFAANPEAEAAKYGKLTGKCCFCHRPLSDTRSTEVGYGPVCSERFGLRWG